MTAFEAVGGEAAVRALVDRFYDLMDLEAAYRDLRALHPSTLDGSRDKLHWFLCGWLGGPQHYVDRFGHPRLRARHLPFAIGVRERDQWLACMAQALDDVACPAHAFSRKLRESQLKFLRETTLLAIGRFDEHRRTASRKRRRRA